MKRRNITIICTLMMLVFFFTDRSLASGNTYETDNPVQFNCAITNLVYENGGSSLYSNSYGRALMSMGLIMDLALGGDSDLLTNFLTHDTYLFRSSYSSYDLIGYTDYSIVLFNYDWINGSACYTLFDRRGISDYQLNSILVNVVKEMTITTYYKNDMDDILSVAAEFRSLLN